MVLSLNKDNRAVKLKQCLHLKQKRLLANPSSANPNKDYVKNGLDGDHNWMGAD